MVNKDNYYIQKVINGDSSSYAFLVEKYKTMAYTIAIRMVKNAEEAEEITQDCFLKAYQSLSNFKGNAKFSTWLYKIIYNQCISELRKKKDTFLPIEEIKANNIQEEEGPVELFGLDEIEQKEQVSKAINMLANDEKAIVTLYYIEETSIAEIAEITGLSKTNTKVKLHRARKKLYETLKFLLIEETT